LNRAFFSSPILIAFRGIVLDTGMGKTISYFRENHRILQGPDRLAGGVPADGPR
jgi:hypothetical protein